MSRLWRVLAVAAALLAAAFAAAWFALPPLLKSQLEQRGSALLGRELRVGQVRIEPWDLAVTLEQLSIAGPAAAAPPLLSIERVRADFDVQSLVKLAPVVESLQVDRPVLQFARTGEGRYDVDDLLERFADMAARSAGSEPQRFALFNLQLRGGELRFDDRPVARSHHLSDLRLELPFLSNLPADIEVTVEPRLAFALDGSPFDAKGRSTPFAAGRASQFQIKLDHYDLAKVWAYLPAGLPLRPAGGRLTTDLALRFEQYENKGTDVQLKGWLEVGEMSLLPSVDAAPLLWWQRLRLVMSDVRPLQRQLLFESLRVDGARLDLRRDAAGQLNLPRATAETSGARPASPAASSAAAGGGSAAAAGWRVGLARLEVEGARADFRDAGTQPAAEYRVDPIALRLDDLRWPVQGESPLKLDAAVAAAGKPALTLHAEGAVSDRHARVDWKLGAVDLEAGAPYLQALLRPRLGGRIEAAGSAEWTQAEPPQIELAVGTARVDDLRLTDAPAPRRGRAEPLLHVPRIELSELRAQLPQRRVSLAALQVQRPFVDIVRDEHGALSPARWLKTAPAATAGKGAPAPAAAAAGTPDAQPAWRAEVRSIKLDGGRVRYRDAALADGPIQVGALRVAAQSLVWPIADGAAPVPTQLAAKIAHPGSATPASIDWSGRVGLLPVSARGKLRVERFPAALFARYAADQLPVAVQRLEAGFKGDLDLRLADGVPAGELRGDALLADLLVTTKPAAGSTLPASELLRWNALAAQPMHLALVPGGRPRLEIGELRIEDYASRLELDEEGNFNLRAATRPGASAPAPVASAAAVAPAAPASAAAPPDASGTAPRTLAGAALSRLPADFVIERTVVSNASVDFQDRFVRPNYRAQMRELNGRIGRLDNSARAMAPIELDGRVAGSGLLEIRGALNPAIVPPALDIQARAQDIDLPGLSPYSAKYAGYPIERGKLSVDVAYKIDEAGKLDAQNHIVVHQLTFGPKSDSPDATKLPVLLAVSLLQDANGVIDIDLPVSGTLDDPQFSLSGLIWKVIVNLLTKAVTSPFSLLAGGEGKEMSAVAFRPGTAQIADSGQQVIDRVAKALADRPGLKLTITGSADLSREGADMRRAALEAKIVEEQRRERARGSLGRDAPAADAPLPAPSAAEREALLERLYDDTRLPDKPRNVIGMAKDVPAAQMQAMLEAAMPADAAAERALALQRGLAVRDALIAKGLPGERLFQAQPKTEPQGADGAAWVPQVQLALGVK